MIDGTGGDPRPAMTVVLEGNRVVETHPSGRPAERQDAVCLDLDGLTVLPGLIDAHAHFGLVEFAPPGTTPVAVLATRILRNCEAGYPLVEEAVVESVEDVTTRRASSSAGTRGTGR